MTIPYKTPDDDEDVLASERVGEARQAARELARDGPAPSVEAVLREMGRGPDGYPIDDGPDEFVAASEAARRAIADVDPTVEVEEGSDR